MDGGMLGHQIQRHVLILGMLVNLIYDKPCPSSRDDSQTRPIISTVKLFRRGDREKEQGWKEGEMMPVCLLGLNEEDQKGG